jgi:hypothetical protein
MFIWFPSKEEYKGVFRIYVFLEFFFQHHIHDSYTNLYLISLHLYLNRYIWFKFKNLKSIQVPWNIIRYFHFNET